MVHHTDAENIGVRVVGTDNTVSREVCRREARELADLKETRADEIDADFMIHRPTGSFRLNFLNSDIANATQLTNIAVVSRPRG